MNPRSLLVPVALLCAHLLACDCRRELPVPEFCAPEVGSPDVKLRVRTGAGACDEVDRSCEVERNGQTLTLRVVDVACQPIVQGPCTEQLLRWDLECDPGTLAPGEYEVRTSDEVKTMTVAEGGEATCQFETP